MVIASVTIIGENIDNSLKNIDLDNFSNAAKDVSDELNVPFVNLRDAYKQYEKLFNCKKINSGLLTYDGIHPNSRGAIMLANMHSEGYIKGFDKIKLKFNRMVVDRF
jgi:lysophospholipase L1-like esterase